LSHAIKDNLSQSRRRITRVFNAARRRSLCIAASFTLVTIASPLAQLNAKAQNVTAVSGTLTGNVQEVGFRAMIQRQAIQYNLAGSVENNNDKTVQIFLQGDKDRVDQALTAIRKGTKKSSDVNVGVSLASVRPDLQTFTVVGWTSVTRHISHPYDLIFSLRPDNTIIDKHEAKKVWLDVCEKAVKGEDAGKCNKNDD
jgi:acylphosphatase